MCKKTLFFFIFLCAGLSLSAQKKLKPYLDYINHYSTLAQKHQSLYKIPSSITLAQGLLESAAGKSRLAVNANNHFGVKCHSDWTGERFFTSGRSMNNCYRKYKKAEDSYEDHSKFLLKHPRYSVLFTYRITDYAAWAKGLQKCGYATDKAYANKLIKIIEDYQLYQYDSVKQTQKEEPKPKEKPKEKEKEKEKPKPKETPSVLPQKRQPYIHDGLLYVMADENDSFDKIAADMGFKVKELLKYNEVPEGFPLNRGDVVYLQKKNKKAAAGQQAAHTVKIGESMHKISQQYGIRLKNLYKLNRKNAEYIPTEGDILKLR